MPSLNKVRIEIERYNSMHHDLWNGFLAHAKNGLFIFDRNYMEYHSDRFEDASLLFLVDGSLVAIMPANIRGRTFESHGGLTFGGIISDNNMKTSLMLEIFDDLKNYLMSEGVESVIYKKIPYIYQSAPCDEDLYAIARFGGKLIRRDVTSAVDMSGKIAFDSNRIRSIKKAIKSGIEVKESKEIPDFMKMVENVLSTRHRTVPTHSVDEMMLLASRFPFNIRLFGSFLNGEMIAGVLVYENRQVAHAQYIASSEVGRKVGALDMIFDYLINVKYKGKRYFDFGISTEDQGRYLNLGLIFQKEGFGARSVVHDFYELRIQ